MSSNKYTSTAYSRPRCGNGSPERVLLPAFRFSFISFQPNAGHGCTCMNCVLGWLCQLFMTINFPTSTAFRCNMPETRYVPIHAQSIFWVCSSNVSGTQFSSLPSMMPLRLPGSRMPVIHQDRGLPGARTNCITGIEQKAQSRLDIKVNFCK